MTIAVDWDIKSQINQTNKQTIFCVANLIRNEQVDPQHMIITSTNDHYSLAMTNDSALALQMSVMTVIPAKACYISINGKSGR